MMIEICKYMGGWDFHTYGNQPHWFIELIKAKMNTEGRIDMARQKAQTFMSKKR